MTSTWRTALEARGNVIRSLKSQAALDVTANYFQTMSSLALQVPDPIMRLKTTERMARLWTERETRAVMRAEPILVESRIMDYVCDLTPNLLLGIQGLEGTYHPDILPIQEGLVVFEEPIEFRDTANHRFAPFVLDALCYGPTHAVSVQNEPGGVRINTQGHGMRVALGVCAYCSSYGNLTPPDGTLLPMILEGWFTGETNVERGRRLARIDPDRTDIALHLAPIYLLMRLFRYMQQPLVVEHQGPPHKGAAKEARRLNVNPNLQVVRWRKEAPRPYDPEHIPVLVDWSCHWQVKQHVRRYKSGKTVVIKPYIKGNRERPFKQPNMIVNMVER
jgi:hypothetical protein